MIKKLIRRIFGPKIKAPVTHHAAHAGPHKPLKPHKPHKRGPQPHIVPVTEHGINPKLVSTNALRVTSTLQQAGFKAYIVGGAVRDLLLGVKPKDFDVATDATPEEIQRHFRRARLIGRRFRLVHVMFGMDTIEVSTFRANLPDNADTDEHGRVLRDNVFGSQIDDATRRDFTVNALYYDPATQTVLDYHHGFEDLRGKVLRIIGDPEKRYREDPMRMLRAVRFASKLGFSIDEATRAPIARLAPLMQNVPPARLFDETLKLLMSGHALECLRQLRAEGLHHGILPLLDVVLEQPLGERFITVALNSTDERVRAGKTISPAFLFACLLWHEVLKNWEARKAADEYPIPALGLAMDDVLTTQTGKLAVQKRYLSDIREIWNLQPRLERRTGRHPWRLIEHQRFRPAYDFLLLRCAAGECDTELGEWWTRFIEGDPVAREVLQTQIDEQPGAGGVKRKRRRRRKPAGSGSGSGMNKEAAPNPEDKT